MVSVLHKKTTAVIKTKASKPKAPVNWRKVLKLTLFLLIGICGIILYNQRVTLLERLDSNPIKSYALTHQPRFTSNADIRAILSADPPLKGYFGQNIDEIQQRFLSLSWIKDVVVRKVYPDKISIMLLEHHPVARWNNKHYLSNQGNVFDLPAERFQFDDLPALFGPDDEGKNVLAAWNKIKQDLKLRNLIPYSIEMDNRGAWTITLDNGVSLRLGRGDWLPKIDRFVAMFPQIDIPADMRLAYVDLRYDHGAAVGFIKK